MCTFITIYIAMFILYLSFCKLLLIRFVQFYSKTLKHGKDKLRTSRGHEEFFKDLLSTSHKQSLSEAIWKSTTKCWNISAAIYHFIEILFQPSFTLHKD